ncbi:Outer membrane protein TolC [Flexibacter flexilis DSM 6793]|uniref:Outer membrane protein TolC n=1 Tax=Flexibacter flexilis DSM 6793 TaxID=927664 RepID=A0A1I1F4P8_9BACT|nr:TolC family protein [Flexibacter flexilis]SFB93912.1 Outer membrane protein TolC [Flexibacter flexilis DSM 6793]
MKYLPKILVSAALALATTHAAQAQDSLQLPDAVAEAIEKNYGVVLATNEAKVSAINNNWGNAGLWPTIGFSGAYNYSNTNLNQELTNGTTIKRNGVNNQSLTGSVALAWTVFDGMKMFATKDRLTELEKTGQTQLRKQMLQTTYTVMIAYYNAVRYQQQIANTQEFIALLTEREKIANRAFQIGSSAKTDLLQSRLDLQTQQIALTQQQTALQKAKAELNRLLTRRPDAPMAVRNRFDVGAAPDFAALESKMLSQNADWLITQHAIATATFTQKEIDSQKWPTLQVLSGYNLSNSRSDAGFTLVNQNYGPYAGLSLRIPILSGNTIRNQKQVAAVQQKSRSIEAESLKNDLQNYFYTARLDYQNAQQIMSQRAGNMELAKENADIALQQFKQKQIDIISLRQVQLNYQEAFTLWLDAQYQLKAAEAYLRLLAADFN